MAFSLFGQIVRCPVRRTLTFQHVCPVTSRVRVGGTPWHLHGDYMSRRGVGSVSSTNGEGADKMYYDVVIVGGGPAGLSCAIRLKQLCSDMSVCLVEKGAEVGSHILSGNVFEPRGLDELLPDWRNRGAPVTTPVKDDRFRILTERAHIDVPMFLMPSMIHNKGNFVISLGALCRWLGSEAEQLGVEIYPGFSAKSLVFDDNKQTVRGIQTSDVGVSKSTEKRSNYQPGMHLLGKQTVLAEGCFGSLTETAIEHFKLREAPLHQGASERCSPQQYGLGLKEVWEIDPTQHVPGRVVHSIGWPLGMWNYGGAFMYHAEQSLLYLGLIIGLDYKNPFLNPYEEFQRLKHHPSVRRVLEGGSCIAYGARCVNEGGVQAVPKLSFPGGVLAGCSAGFLNVPKIKGAHNAMKSGMIAAECIAFALTSSHMVEDRVVEVSDVNDQMRVSWAWKELNAVRNSKPSFKKGGLLGGLIYTGISLHCFRGAEPWTFRWITTDSDSTQPASKHTPIVYPERIHGLSFNLLDNLARSGTNHEHDQPSHLKIKKGMEDIPVQWSWKVMGAPESRFCPAGVYEYVADETANPSSSSETVRLQINAQNCVHCKCCGIKTPKQYIQWDVPEGSGGPAYENM
eukprot:GHVQ01039104.1.p1 GENE.GHVQ01039104.1~~GHVQ01039104.1.p1  ORF type:complete len:625 (+),score=49.40 GHVQ01039104.1:4149-6023(+)